MEQFKNEEFSKADVVRDVSGLSFAEVCRACMTQDADAKVTLVLNNVKGRNRKQTRRAIEWINLGSSKNVVCEKLHVFGTSEFQVNGYSR